MGSGMLGEGLAISALAAGANNNDPKERFLIFLLLMEVLVAAD